MKRRSMTHDELANRLRADAAAFRREPSSGLRPRIMASLASARGRGRLHDPKHVGALPFRRLAAAAMIALTATAATFLLPRLGYEGGANGVGEHGGALIGDAGGAVGIIDHEPGGPALVQPLREAFAIAMDAESPLEAEANRMLADAAQAGRLVLNRLPFRGHAGESIEQR